MAKVILLPSPAARAYEAASLESFGTDAIINALLGLIGGNCAGSGTRGTAGNQLIRAG